jgi:photosystem II stability/assembly factor-like uncharacterized protein
MINKNNFVFFLGIALILIAALSVANGCGKVAITTTTTSTTITPTTSSTTTTTLPNLYTISRLTSNTTQELTRASFIDNNNGWVSGLNGTLIRTTNGSSWTTVPLPLYYNLDHIWALHLVSLTSCWASFGNVIYRTDDTGLNWTHQDYYGSFNMFFIDNNNGWSITAGKIRKWDGSIWDEQNCPTTEALNSLFFVSSAKGWVAGMSQIIGTNNGGSNWTSLYSFDEPVYTTSIAFKDSSEGWLSASNFLYKTTDGGYSWALATIETSVENFTFIEYITFSDQDFGMFIGTKFNAVENHKYIGYTFNGGTTWQAQSCGTFEPGFNFNYLCLVSSSCAYAVGKNGMILKISK